MSRVGIIDGADLVHQRNTALAGNYVLTTYAPGDRKRLLLTLRVALTTDATVANRQIQVQLYDGALGILLSETIIGQNIAASTTGYLTLGAIAALSGATVSSGDYATILPDKWWLSPDVGIRITILNGVAGDAYLVEGYYKEMPL